MQRTHRTGRRRIVTCLLAGTVVALGASAAPAMAADQIVTGTTQGLLALTPGTAPLFTTNFQPSGTATANGTLTATNTAAISTLTVIDSTVTTPGKMDAAVGATCTGSDTSLTTALTTGVTGTGVATAGVKSISSTSQTVASATAPISAALLTAAYSQAIPAAQVMLTGCVYTLTATYTLS